MYPKSSTVINGTEFTVNSKYRLIKPIGAGAYGIVVSAEDTTNGKKTAIKKVQNAFHDLIDAKRILREIKLMRFFGEHENLVTLYDMEEPMGPTGFEDVYLITELMETDLHRIIYSKQKLTDEHVAYFVYQILRALKYMHSANVIHRDLKPSNILVNSNCDLRVCDFGLARGIHDYEGVPLTEYVVTRWYRAPEIMLARRDYTKAVDVWAVGCIMGELMRRKPLFAGSDYMDQLKLITTMLGSPSEDDMSFIRSERARSFMAKLAGKPRQPWSNIIKRANPLALDLLDKMLEFHPDKRITVDEALAHPYLATLHCPEDEPSHPAAFDFSFEKGVKLDKPALQKLMYEEIIGLKRGIASTCAIPKSVPPPPASAPAAPSSGAMPGMMGGSPSVPMSAPAAPAYAAPTGMPGSHVTGAGAAPVSGTMDTTPDTVTPPVAPSAIPIVNGCGGPLVSAPAHPGTFDAGAGDAAMFMSPRTRVRLQVQHRPTAADSIA